MIIPPLLTKGDKVVIIAPSKYVNKTDIDYAKSIIIKWGLNVQLGNNTLQKHKYYSATSQQRAEDLQWAINSNEIKAIFCARGGYGASKIIDEINFKPLIKNPKWVIGFSDITIIHLHLAMLKISSIHSNMPALFKSQATQDSLSSIKTMIFNKNNSFSFRINKKNNNQNTKNIKGNCKGTLIGGNLSMICHALATKTNPNYEDKILFLEDVGEYYYAIDRYLNQIKRARILNKIKGIVIGSFNNIKEDDTFPFQQSLDEIFASYFSPLKIPVAYGYPAGHIKNNIAIGFGMHTSLTVNDNNATITFQK